MRIGVDARELSGKPTGVGRYLAGLLREWTDPAASHGHDIRLYAHRDVQWAAGRCAVSVRPGAGGTLWEQRDLARALADDGVDVLFSPAYSTPLLTRVPRVVALHDISFVARPDWYRWREGLRRRVLARRSAAASRTVVTISEFSKSEIVSRLGVAPAKVRVIPPGIDVPGYSTASADGPAHLLYVGSIFNRRHLPLLVEAFSRLAATRPEAILHIVGDNRSHPHEDLPAIIAGSPAAHRIEWHRYVPDATLQVLYRQARGFVFLSEYEGLGLTPLEALAAGIPSLLLDTPVARESCGDAALYAPLGSADLVADALNRLLFEPRTRERLLAAAPGVLARYDWRTAAAATLKTLEDAV